MSGWVRNPAPRRDHGIKQVFNNAMCAHVWAQQTQQEGRNRKGSLYFEGKTLFSYGSHYAVGRIEGDVAFINASSYSPTTVGHRYDAINAVTHKTVVRVPELTALIPAFEAWDGLLALHKQFNCTQDSGKYQKGVRQFEAWLLAHANKASNLEYVLNHLSDAPGYPQKTAEEWSRLSVEKYEADRQAERARDLARDLRAARHGMAEGLAEAYRKVNDARHDQYQLDRYAKQATQARKAALTTDDKPLQAFTLQLVRCIRDARRALAKHVAIKLRNAQLSQAIEILRANITSPGSYAFKRISAACTPLIACRRVPAATREKLQRVQHEAIGLVGLLHKQEARAEFERERQSREAWLNGGGPRYPYFSAEDGSALLRVKGETLETSHGASVPLDHAIRAFRIIADIRAKGESWHRNGHAIHVGHFQLDEITPDGALKAGCHRIGWPEIERIAKHVGVYD